MVSQIRKRPRADAHQNQVRKAGGGYGRYVYLAVLVAMALALLNYAIGDRLLLRADGMVLRNRTVVGASSLMRVDKVMVHEGEQVRAGDVLFEVSSFEHIDRLADLAVREADLAKREAEIFARRALVRELSDNARRRVVEAELLVTMEERIVDPKILRQERLVQALEAVHDAVSVATRLASEAKTLDGEAEALAHARRQMAAARDAAVGQFADGLVRAPATGTVDVNVPLAGEVFRPGEPMISIQTGAPYVLAYLPTSYLFPIGPDTAVRVSSGNKSARARVSEILPLSAEVPVQFQTAFRRGQRRQLARIVFEEKSTFPVTATVEIASAASPAGWLEDARSIFAGWIGGLGPNSAAAGQKDEGGGDAP